MKFSSSKGKQKPEALEAGSPDVLEQAVNGGSDAKVGATFTLKLTSEEEVEANAIL
jgi:hypothetical protein